MNGRHTLALIALLLAVATLSACNTTPKKNLALEQVRNELDELKSDSELAGYAPLALGEAERALRQAESATGSDKQRDHLVYMADRRIQVARAMAQRELFEEELDALEDQESEMRVRASQLEAQLARAEADRAIRDSQTSAEEAQRAREYEQASLLEAEQALAEAQQARRLADTRAAEVELARREAELAGAQAEALQRQLDTLQLRQTESGVVVTLGDVLFETGQSQLRTDAQGSLDEVVELLQVNPAQKIRIEGHTDSTGDAAANQALSERRAESVRTSLVSLGVDDSRLSVVGLGEDFPIAQNDTEEGRSRNRRVDVILLDESL